jgi:surface protein
MKAEINNEIKISIKVRYWELGEKIYFMNNVENNVSWFPGDKRFHNIFDEMNEKNTELFIEGKKYKFNKFFIPQKEGIYSIKIKFNFLIKDCSYMFYNCYNLIDVDLSSFNTRNVTNMEGMFSCNELKNIDLSLINTENVTNMSSLFNFCVNLENCILSNFNTYLFKKWFRWNVICNVFVQW